MNNECTDRDLLAAEPAIFTGGGFEAQQLIAGVDGACAGTAFTSAAAIFTAAGVKAGMALCLYSSSAAAAELRAYEIVSVDSATRLTVSVLRADRSEASAAPPAGSGWRYYVVTFAPQLAAARAALCEQLRRLGEGAGIDPADYADSAQFRQAVTLAALAAIFTARAANATSADANWVKAEFYRGRHVEAAASLRLAYDAGGDGRAEQTRELGNVRLRRS